MNVSELRVEALGYRVTATEIVATWIRENGREQFSAGRLADLLPRLDRLRDALRRTVAVARDRVPQLEAFGQGWGRGVLPADLLSDPPDVLVIVPHSVLHGVPLHVAATDSGVVLGVRTGATYTSSMSLFVRCASRNAARRLDPDRWSFDPYGGPAGATAAFAPSTLAVGGCDMLGDKDEAFADLALSAAQAARGSRVLDASGLGFGRVAAKHLFRVKPPAEAICIAAHGYLDPDDHRYSGLLVDRQVWHGPRWIHVYGLDLRFEDVPVRHLPPALDVARPAELLTAAELEIDARAETQLVLLLACSAGWSAVLQADEPASIAETFAHIGAPSVVAPMWDSDYEATRAWVLSFMHAWAACGMPKALAARRAMEQLLADGIGPERAGTLTLRGDWL